LFEEDEKLSLGRQKIDFDEWEDKCWKRKVRRWKVVLENKKLCSSCVGMLN